MRRDSLVALMAVGTIGLAACTDGLRVGDAGGSSASGGDTGSQGFTATTGGNTDSSSTLNNSLSAFCPCANASKAAYLRTDPAERGDASGLFISVSMGSNYDTGCGVRADRTITCWGAYLYPYDTPPAGTFQSVSVGAYFACGVRTDGSIVCWGNSPPTAPTGTFSSVSVSTGLTSACAIRTDGTVTCWAASPRDSLLPPKDTFTAISVGPSVACAVKTDGALACWNKSGPVAPPDGRFISISVGLPSLCGVKSDRTIACYVPAIGGCGSSEVDSACGSATPPEGSFTSVSVGEYLGCGVSADGTLFCWGLISPFKLVGTFTSVSVGGVGAVCAVRTDGALICWFDGHRESGGPEGGF